MTRKPFLGEAESIRLPRPPAQPVTPDGFMLCPVALMPMLSAPQLVVQQWIYLRALEEAQAVARPSLLERDLLGVWN